MLKVRISLGSVVRVLAAMLLLVSHNALATEYSGELAWADRVGLGVLVSGVVADVGVKPGQQVTAGTVLLTLDARLYRARLAMAEAELTRLTLVKDEAERELERAKELYERTLLSEHDLQVATIGQRVADAEYKQAQAKRVRSQLDYEHSRIIAPFDALVLDVSAVKGQSINALFDSGSLVTVAARDVMLARLTLSGEQIDALRTEQSATVSVGGSTFEGRIAAIAMEPDPQGRYRVDVIFSHLGQRGVRAGQKVNVRIP